MGFTLNIPPLRKQTPASESRPVAGLYVMLHRVWSPLWKVNGSLAGSNVEWGEVTDRQTQVKDVQQL